MANGIGAKKRSAGQMPNFYLNRVKRMLRLASVYGAPRDGARLLEIGTGWLHWEAVATRLFFDVHGVLFDVWDNRQMEGLKNYLNQLDKMLQALDVDDHRRNKAHRMISLIQDKNSYQDLYDLLGFEYVIDERGRLDSLEKGAFDLVVSAGVLEHIYANEAEDFVHGIASSLKPGGLSAHIINFRDHLGEYDNMVSSKQYLHYPDWIWSLCFESQIQYINRLQRSDWLDLFTKAGLELVEEEVEAKDPLNIKVAKIYQKYEEKDLQCGGLKIVHRKSV